MRAGKEKVAVMHRLAALIGSSVGRVRLFAAVSLPTKPKSITIPGLNTLAGIVSDVTRFGLVIALLGLVVSAARMGIGHHAGNPSEVTKGKHGVLASLLAAILLGAASTIITVFAKVGGGL